MISFSCVQISHKLSLYSKLLYISRQILEEERARIAKISEGKKKKKK